VEFANLPKCQRCKVGDLVPLSDFGGQGAAVHYKAWACINPDCGFNPTPRWVAFPKLKAMVDGARIVRRELGFKE